jgi:hypothetical protein
MAHTFEVAFSLGAAQQSGFKVSIGQAVSQVNQLGKEVRALGDSRRTTEKFQVMNTRIKAARKDQLAWAYVRNQKCPGEIHPSDSEISSHPKKTGNIAGSDDRCCCPGGRIDFAGQGHH